MQKKLLIYETTHYETLPALVELALEQFEAISIYADSADIYDSCRHFTACQSSNIKWITKPSSTSNLQFISQVFSDLESNNYSHFFVNSLDHNLYFFTRKLSRIYRNVHTVLNVHTIHDYTSSRYNSILNVSESLAKKKLHQIIKNCRVLAPAMPAYLKSRLPGLTVEYIPGMFYQPFPSPKFQETPFRIVVPGTVEEKRRDYEIIPTVVSLLAQKNRDRSIELVILGNSNTAFGKKLEKDIREVLPATISLIRFDRDVAYDTYSKYYSSAHIIWAPVKLNMESIRGVPEINGLSNSAGLFVDFVHYAHPTLIPEVINFDDKLDPLFLRYTDPKDAADKIETFLHNPNILVSQQEKIQSVCTAYTADKFREAFKKLMAL